MRANPSSKSDGFADFNHLNSLLSGADQRGLVLSLSAFAEDSLGELLQAFMRDHPATTDLVHGFNAPLGTLSSRIKASAALGLITANQHKDLEILRRIRNRFSHTWKDISLDDEGIRSQIESLSFSSIEDDFPNNPFDKIRSSMFALLDEIRTTIHLINKNELRAKLISTRLFAGLSGNNEAEQISDAESRFEKLRTRFHAAERKEQEFILLMRERLLQRIEYAVAVASPEARDKLGELALRIGSPNWLNDCPDSDSKQVKY